MKPLDPSPLAEQVVTVGDSVTTTVALTAGERDQMFAHHWRSMENTFGGRKIDRWRREYGEHETTLTIECGEDRLIICQPGLTKYNAWIYALMREISGSHRDEIMRHVVADWETNPLDKADQFAWVNLRWREYPEEDRRFTRRLFGHKCACCEVPLGKHGGHIDHHRPKSKGYKLSRNNAVLLCAQCNMRKSSRYPREWYAPGRLAFVEGLLNAAQG